MEYFINNDHKKSKMETITINVADYYGNPSYYSVMPESIFDALELANLNGEATCKVSKSQFDEMIIEYKKKMEQWKG